MPQFFTFMLTALVALATFLPLFNWLQVQRMTPTPAPKADVLPAQNGPPPPAQPPDRDAAVTLNKRAFVLPVEMSANGRKMCREIRLYRRTRRTEWALHQTADSSVQKFDVKVTEDGEYGFAMVTVDKNGRLFPADINSEPPGIRVIVKTELAANSPAPPGLPHQADSPPRVAKSSPLGTKAEPALEVTIEGIDAHIERAFGKDRAESKRPIRLWLRKMDIIIAAQEATILQDSAAARFNSASIVLTATGQQKTFRDVDIVVNVGGPITGLKDVSDRTVKAVVIHGKPEIMIIRPNAPIEIDPNLPPPIKPLEKVDPPQIPPPPKPGQPNFEIRYKFNIDPKAPLADLLPTPVTASPKLPYWANEDLTKVPELTIGEPLSKKLSRQDAMEKTAHVMAKINHLNANKRDGFVLAMLEHRPELRGLPFLMGVATANQHWGPGRSSPKTRVLRFCGLEV